ncbi:MAG: hypothetical protein AAB415_01495 [Patescibacteria group bacterium]
MKPISPLIQFLVGLVALTASVIGLKSQMMITTPESELPWRVAVINPFAGLKLEAKAALVYEPDTGRILYAKAEHERLPIASMTKLMTALTATELLPDSTVVPLAARHYRLKDLVALTLVSSSNPGALALASATADNLGRDLVAEMNTQAHSLGLNQTTFTNPTGLDLEGGEAGSYSSAYDIARLFTHILTVRPELLAATRLAEIETGTIEGLRHRFQNTNEIVRDLPGLLGSKTGFTDIAEGSLVIAFDRGLNQPVVMVVLGSSEQGRFHDIKQLVETTIKSFLPPA